MDIRYSLWDPSGNVTLLVETPVAAEEQPAVAAGLMAREPSAEQVGFLSAGTEAADVGLRMAGGEFCGNAAMSAAVWQATRTAEAVDAVSAAARPAEQVVLVEASGAPEPVAVTVAPKGAGAWRCSLQMPAPTAVTAVDLPLPGGEALRLPIVHFDGISHIILEHAGALTPKERVDAEQRVREWSDALGLDGLGLLFFDRAASRMTPLVSIRTAGTLFWENACGSGTCAVGAYLAAGQGAPVTLALQQPGGTLEVSTSRTGTLTLTGTVRKA